MNGVIESLVKSVKRSLESAVGDQVLSFVELQTTMFESAQLVNQRPIGRHPTSSDDGVYLCQNDLLLGRSTSDIPQGPFANGSKFIRRFYFIQSLVDSFWKRWTRNFFPSLIIRNKWHVDRRDVKIGDIVLVKDSNEIRGKWRLGRVTKTHASKDERVRKVTIICKPAVTDANSTCRLGTGKLKSVEIERAVHNLIVVAAVDEERK